MEMYYHNLFFGTKKEKDSLEKPAQRFFTSHVDAKAFLKSTMYPFMACYEESLPTSMASAIALGAALYETALSLGALVLGQFKDAKNHAVEAGHRYAYSAGAALVALLAPVFELARFLTQWGTTVYHNVVSMFQKPAAAPAANPPAATTEAQQPTVEEAAAPAPAM